MAAALSGEGSDAGEGSRAADTAESSAAADWRWRDIKNERRDPLNLDSCPFCPVFERTA